MQNRLKILLYIPNIIGYFRILLLILSYTLQKTSFRLFFLTYFLSFALDALDGIAARALNQCSKFGALLDMLTDRMATLVIIFICLQLEIPADLSISAVFGDFSVFVNFFADFFVFVNFFADFRSFFVFVIVLDLVSHWLQTLVAAQSGSHHKNMKNFFRLLDFYYNSKIFMCILCVGYELFFLVFVYILSFGDYSGFVVFLFLFTGVLGGIKSFINVQQLVSNVIVLIDQDIEDKRNRDK